jgi:hypothetical protein
MLEEVDAIRFDRGMATGKTRPVLLSCERHTGGEVEVVAKFSFGCNNSTEALVREALTAMLAVDLGLPMPEPLVVRVTPAFISTVPIAPVAEYLRKSVPLGFGTRKLPDGFNVWGAGTPAKGALEQQALEILAFDVLVTNADRRPENPNLLCNGSEFAIFDHEMALMTDLNFFWKPPWEANSLSGFYSPKSHVLFPSLNHERAVDLQRLQGALASISDERISAYAAAIPNAWLPNTEALERGIKLIEGLRDHADSAIEEVRKALA